MTTTDSSARLVLASHKYGWKTSEIVPMIVLPIVSLAIAWNTMGGFNVSAPVWWLVALSGFVFSGFLFWLGASRKNKSRLELVEESDYWRLYRGGEFKSEYGTYVHSGEVTHAGVSVHEFTGRRDVLLSIVNAKGLTIESLQIPERLLSNSPALCEELRSIVERDTDNGESAQEVILLLDEVEKTNASGSDN